MALKSADDTPDADRVAQIAGMTARSGVDDSAAATKMWP